MSETETYYEFIETIKSKFGSFVLDAEAGVDNKSAALRARKLSMELRKDLQDFRKVSVDNDRSNTKHRSVDEVPATTPEATPGEAVEMPDEAAV